MQNFETLERLGYPTQCIQEAFDIALNAIQTIPPENVELVFIPQEWVLLAVLKAMGPFGEEPDAE